jgi:hypothetical protein
VRNGVWMIDLSLLMEKMNLVKAPPLEISRL